MVSSFGRPPTDGEPFEDEEELEPLPQQVQSAGRVTLEVDLAVSDESLVFLEEQMTSMIARAVIAGFAAAALQQQN